MFDIDALTTAPIAERDEAWRALRWIYQNGMQPDHIRPEWVSQVLSDAFGPVRAGEVSRQD